MIPPWQKTNKLIKTSNYVFKASNKINENSCVLWSMLEIKAPEQLRWNYSGDFIIEFEQIPHLFLTFPLIHLCWFQKSENDANSKWTTYECTSSQSPPHLQKSVHFNEFEMHVISESPGMSSQSLFEVSFCPFWKQVFYCFQHDPALSHRIYFYKFTNVFTSERPKLLELIMELHGGWELTYDFLFFFLFIFFCYYCIIVLFLPVFFVFFLFFHFLIFILFSFCFHFVFILFILIS